MVSTYAAVRNITYQQTSKTAAGTVYSIMNCSYKFHTGTCYRCGRLHGMMGRQAQCGQKRTRGMGQDFASFMQTFFLDEPLGATSESNQTSDDWRRHRRSAAGLDANC